MSGFPSFLRPTNVPLHVYITFCLIQQLSLGLLPPGGHCASCSPDHGGAYLFNSLLPALLGVSREVELLVIPLKSFAQLPRSVHRARTIYVPNSARGLSFLHILTSYLFFWGGGLFVFCWCCYFCLWIMAILMNVTWFLTVILIYIFLMLSDVEHLFVGVSSVCISSLEECLFP